MTTLRPPEERDIDALHALVRLPSVRWGTGRVPHVTRSWIEDRVPNRDPNVTSVIAEVDGTVIGWASLVRDTERRAHVGDIGLCVHDDHQGQGYGRTLMNALLDTADNWLGLRRLVLEVNIDNAAAIALYQSLGFETEGRLRGDILRDGVLIDNYLMARLRPAVPMAHAPKSEGPLQ